MTLKYKSWQVAALTRFGALVALGGGLLLVSTGAQQQATQEPARGAATPAAATSSSAQKESTGVASESAAIDALATKLAEAIKQTKQKSVIVLDFADTDGRVTPLGQKLADDFSTALANGATNLTVHPREQTPACRSNLFYYGNSDVGMQEARDRNAKVAVFGRMATDAGGVDLSIEAYQVDKLKSLGAFRVQLPVTPELKAAMDTAPGKDSETSGAKSGDAGYGFPACVECPRIELSAEAVRHHVRGVVVLFAVVGTDGRACNITVEKKLGYGLDEKAIETVLKWRFKPANGPDGLPAAVRVPIEIEIR
jgi:TonB family protein